MRNISIIIPYTCNEVDFDLSQWMMHMWEGGYTGKGLTQQEEERKTKEKIHECSEMRHVSSGCDRGRYRRQNMLKKDDAL